MVSAPPVEQVATDNRAMQMIRVAMLMILLKVLGSICWQAGVGSGN